MDGQENCNKVKPVSPSKNEVVAKSFKKCPATTAPAIPVTPPQKPINKASILKVKKTLKRPIPIAFIKPISRVRS